MGVLFLRRIRVHHFLVWDAAHPQQVWSMNVAGLPGTITYYEVRAP